MKNGTKSNVRGDRSNQVFITQTQTMIIVNVSYAIRKKKIKKLSKSP